MVTRPTDYFAEAKSWPLAGPAIGRGRLHVLANVDNTGSISASFNDYEILRGIRKVPMKGWTTDLFKLFYATNDHEHAHQLAERIRASRSISPLIVAVDRKSGPYVLEGAHRLGALGLLRATSFPALVVLDLD